MTYITCSYTVSSVIFAHLLKMMLGLHDSVIIWKDLSPSNAKNTVSIDSYTHEYLLVEYERRYGSVAWFHDHSEIFSEAKDLFQQVLDTHEGEAETYSEIVRNILENNTSKVAGQLSRLQRPLPTLKMLTTSLRQTGWAQ